MKKGTVVNLRGFKFIDFFRKNYMLLVVSFFLVLGIALGCFLKSNKVLELTQGFFKHYLAVRADCTFFGALFSSVTVFVLTLLVLFVFGASMLGVAVAPLFITLVGYCYGSAAVYLYSSYALKGVAFNALVLLPCLLVLFVTLVFSAGESIGFSLLLARATLPRSRPVNLFSDFRLYCGRYALFALFILFSAILEALLSRTFIGFFDF